MTEKEILEYIETDEHHIFLHYSNIWSKETDDAITKLYYEGKIIRCSKYQPDFMNSDYHYTTPNRSVVIRNLGHGDSELVAI